MGVIIRIFGTKWHDPRHWDSVFGTRNETGPRVRRSRTRGPGRKTLAARYSPAADCRSTLATGALHFRVRNGNGCCLPAMATKEKTRKTRTAAGMPRHGTGSAASMPRHGTKDESKAVRSVPAHTCAGRRRMLAPGQPSREHGSEAKCKEGKAQASRTISTGRVNASPRLRLRPIEVVVFHRP